MENLKELIEIHEGRGRFYRFLSKCFNDYLDEKLYKLLSDMMPVIRQMKENSDNEDISEGADGLNCFGKERSGLKGDELKQFDEESLLKYTQLFCLAGASVNSDESYYTSPEKLIMQESYAEMRTLFKKYKLTLPEEYRQYEDNISSELYFMSQLSFMSGAALQKNLTNKYNKLIKAQQDFHKNHFCKWVGTFFHRVISHPAKNEVIYKSISKLAQGFINEDRLLLSDLTAK